MGRFYLNLSSKDSKSARPGNTFSNFMVELPRKYHFETVQSVFALTDISIVGLADDNNSLLPEPLAVLCDISNDSYIGEGFLPILRTLPSATDLSASLFQSYYIAVNTSGCSKIRIYLKKLRTEGFKSPKVERSRHHAKMYTSFPVAQSSK